MKVKCPNCACRFEAGERRRKPKELFVREAARFVRELAGSIIKD